MRILEQMGTLWFFDMLAPEITFRFDGKRGVRTWFGLLLTVFYLGAVSAFSYMIALTYLRTDAPTVVVDTNQAGKTHHVHLGEHNLLPVFYMLLNEQAYIPPETASTYFTLRFYKYKMQSVIGADGRETFEIKTIQMSVVPCKELKKNATAFQYYAKWQNDESFKRYALDQGLCIHGNPEELFVDGMGTSSSLDMLIFQALPCSLGPQCAPFSTVKRVTLTMATPLAVVNNSNYENPVSFVLSSDAYFYITDGLRQTYQTRFSLTTINDDLQSWSNIFEGKEQRTAFFSYDKSIQTSSIRSRNSAQTTCSQPEILARQCEAYIQLEYLPTPKKIIVARVYKSLTRTLSEIGGINSVAFLIFYYLNRLFCYFAQKRIVVDKVFEFFPEEEQRRKKLKKSKISAAKSPSPSLTGESDPEDFSRKLASLGDKEFGQLKQEAFGMIQETTDVVYIARELIVMKAALHFLLDNHHKKVAPLMVLLSRHKPNDQIRKAQLAKKEENQVLDPKYQTPWPDNTSEEKLSTTGALQKLYDSLSETKSQEASARKPKRHGLTEDLNRFFFQAFQKIGRKTSEHEAETAWKLNKKKTRSLSSAFDMAGEENKTALEKNNPNQAAEEPMFSKSIKSSAKGTGESRQLPPEPRPRFSIAQDFILNSDSQVALEGKKPGHQASSFKPVLPSDIH